MINSILRSLVLFIPFSFSFGLFICCPYASINLFLYNYPKYVLSMNVNVPLSTLSICCIFKEPPFKINTSPLNKSSLNNGLCMPPQDLAIHPEEIDRHGETDVLGFPQICQTTFRTLPILLGCIQVKCVISPGSNLQVKVAKVGEIC